MRKTKSICRQFDAIMTLRAWFLLLGLAGVAGRADAAKLVVMATNSGPDVTSPYLTNAPDLTFGAKGFLIGVDTEDGATPNSLAVQDLLFSGPGLVNILATQPDDASLSEYPKLKTRTEAAINPDTIDYRDEDSYLTDHSQTTLAGVRAWTPIGPGIQEGVDFLMITASFGLPSTSEGGIRPIAYIVTTENLTVSGILARGQDGFGVLGGEMTETARLNFQNEVLEVPEPSTFVLLALGAAACMVGRRLGLRRGYPVRGRTSIAQLSTVLRRVMNSGFSLVVATGIAFNLPAICPAATYSLTDLGTLGGSFDYSSAYGINGEGQVVGSSYVLGDTRHAFLWSSGSMTDLGTLGGDTSLALDINDAGQIVGESSDSADAFPTRAFLYSNGVMTDLGTLGGTHSNGFAINNLGLIVGGAEIGDGSLHLFSYSNGAMSDLGTLPSGDFAYGLGVNDSGQIVGEATPGISGYRAILYENSVMTDLGTLGGNISYLDSRAHDINESGQIVGGADTIDFYFHAFLYDNGTMTDLGTLGGTSSRAFGINNHNQIVGRSRDAANDDRAFLFEAGTMWDLTQLVDASGTGWALEEATAINDSGWIVANGRNPDGRLHALLLTPVPEPSTLVLFSFGVAACGAVSWRRTRRSRCPHGTGDLQPGSESAS